MQPTTTINQYQQQRIKSVWNKINQNIVKYLKHLGVWILYRGAFYILFLVIAGLLAWIQYEILLWLCAHVPSIPKTIVAPHNYDTVVFSVGGVIYRAKVERWARKKNYCPKF